MEGAVVDLSEEGWCIGDGFRPGFEATQGDGLGLGLGRGGIVVGRRKYVRRER